MPTNESTDDDTLSKGEAFRKLDQMSGQSYQLPETAHDILQPFSGDATDGFLEEYDCEDFPVTVFPEAIAETQVIARDARGITSVHAYQPILTGADISAILVDALGEEPSDAVMGGAGFTADERHEENLATLREALEVDDG